MFMSLACTIFDLKTTHGIELNLDNRRCEYKRDQLAILTVSSLNQENVEIQFIMQEFNIIKVICDDKQCDYMLESITHDKALHIKLQYDDNIFEETIYFQSINKCIKTLLVVGGCLALIFLLLFLTFAIVLQQRKKLKMREVYYHII
ncbi:hypothetical protein SS50377_25965 [Spironucleus salmonicida]|uniref:Transmembrane protein n=1 Tax=Spironucleus salmonicida TaxID=348837 RepID=V6LSR6_9EUKA|nr:hypothetical protein SS50377_25965 [Spironucleus salmonicida]|eukprot:EST47293.1 Hypothetical protein SS50377_12640 [Spironucleus salmonicida]